MDTITLALILTAAIWSFALVGLIVALVGWLYESRWASWLSPASGWPGLVLVLSLVCLALGAITALWFGVQMALSVG